jgi:hypothetical protein
MILLRQDAREPKLGVIPAKAGIQYSLDCRSFLKGTRQLRGVLDARLRGHDTVHRNA